MKKIKNQILKITSIIFNRQYRRNNQEKCVTLISQNCIGGVLYSMLNLPFSSPTIDMFIEGENFVKLAENPHYYFGLDAVPYEEKHIDSVGDDELCYPTIKVGDIVLCCLHYKNCNTAVDAWNRRRLRVNYDKMFIISCSWNLHENEDYIKRISNLPYPNIIFTTEDRDYPNCKKLQSYKYKKDCWGTVTPALTSFKGLTGKRYFVDEFDFVNWINGFD